MYECHGRSMLPCCAVTQRSRAFFLFVRLAGEVQLEKVLDRVGVSKIGVLRTGAPPAPLAPTPDPRPADDAVGYVSASGLRHWRLEANRRHGIDCASMFRDLAGQVAREGEQSSSDAA